MAAERLKRPLHTASRLAVSTVRTLLRKLGQRPRHDDAAKIEARARTGIRDATRWEGHGSLAVAPSSAPFRRSAPLIRRTASNRLTGGFVPGWLRIAPSGIDWIAEKASGSTHAVVLSFDDIAAIELEPFKRRTAGLTVITRETDELWLLVDDRRKLDKVLSALRYRS